MIFSGYSGFSSIKADSRIITELLMRVVLNTISLPLPFPLLHIWTINTSNYTAWNIDFSKTKTSACSEDRPNICPFLIHNILTGLWHYSKSNPTVILVEQELPTHLEHLISPQILSGVRVTRSIIFCVVFVEHWLSVCPVSFGHCIVCGFFSVYGFWLFVWYLQTFLNGQSSKLKTCIFYFVYNWMTHPLPNTNNAKSSQCYQ
jgi:hypothetical protein